ncbi:MAG TPA: hypothetical protein VMM56_10605, partial [Planctomycetaceae bacterium]|nr:hypothetical protein [Planctomycetaceae bacterium]
RAMKWIGSGGCFFLALFCGYGFLASGELSGTPELMWKTGYAVAGLLAFCGAVYAASHESGNSKTGSD